MSRQNSILHLVRELLHIIRLRLRLLPAAHELVKLGVHRVCPREVAAHFVLFDREARFDGFLAGPVFAMRFALDEYLGVG